jgi:hypothetical protein
MRVPAGRGSGSARLSGRVRWWIPLALLAGGSIWALQRLAEPVEAAEFTAIDLHRVRLRPPQGSFCDPRWEAELAATLARLRSPDAHDAGALASVAEALAALPFVAETGVPRVLWPDGLEVPLRLREPVACVRTGAEFRIVSEDGVILPGNWPEPPEVEGRPLPVIGPNDGAFDRRPAGARLAERRHLDGLAVAVSMRRGLAAVDAQALGPLLIDATRSPQTSVEEPGTLLELEQQRLVLFGRAPGSGQPGELPDELKWRSLSKAAALLRGDESTPPQDWSVVDLRWDTPAIRPRDPNAPKSAQQPRKSTSPEPKPVAKAPKSAGVR